MTIVLTYIFAIVILVTILKLIGLSMKIIARFIINAVIGGIVICLINLFGAGITLTWLTAAIVGFLGVPGVIIVLIMQFLF